VWLGGKVTGVLTRDPVPPECNVIMIATGTGLAPYVSMMRTSLAEETKRRFVVVHGARHSWELGYSAEMLALQHLSPRFDYIPIISRPKEEPVPWQGFVGYCQDVWKDSILGDLLGRRPDPGDAHIFLCGNPSMIEEMAGLVAADGFVEHSRKSPGQVHMEKYW
jgi:ferredoxin--NADP+ reductase